MTEATVAGHDDPDENRDPTYAASADESDDTSPAAHSRRRRRSWIVRLVAFALGAMGLSLSWAISSPIGATPDESNHIIYAYGIVGGDALPWNMQIERDDANRPFTDVRMPAELLDFPRPACYLHQPSEPTQCDLASDHYAAQGLVDDDGYAHVATHMTAYPVLYYAAAGLVLHGGLAVGLSGAHTLIAARVLSGLLGALLIGIAGRVLLRRYGAPGVIAAIAVACTPMVFFLLSAINPNGFEIAATLLLAATVVAIRHDVARTGRTKASLDLLLVVGVFAVTWSRPLSVAWAGLLVLVLLAPVRRGRRLPLFVVRWPAVAITALIGIAGVAWMLWSESIRESAGLQSDVWDALPFSVRSVLVLLKFGDLLQQSLGVFNWADTWLPDAAIAWWAFAALTMIVALHVAARPAATRPWLAWAFLAGSATVVFVQSILGAFGWQGRYWLPALGAFALLLVPALQGRAIDPTRRRRLVMLGTTALLLLVGFSLLWQLWRNMYGMTYFFQRFDMISWPWEDAGWYPPGGQRFVAFTGLGGMVLLLAAVWLTLRQDDRPPADDVDEPGTDHAETVVRV